MVTKKSHLNILPYASKLIGSPGKDCTIEQSPAVPSLINRKAVPKVRQGTNNFSTYVVSGWPGD